MHKISIKEKQLLKVRITTLRKVLGCSLEELAKAAGSTRQVVNSWEKLGKTPDWFSLENMKKNINVNPGWIMTGKGEIFNSLIILEIITHIASQNCNVDELLNFVRFQKFKSK
jgi:transcriptional regulator with XRE-family HTH domain